MEKYNITMDLLVNNETRFTKLTTKDKKISLRTLVCFSLEKERKKMICEDFIDQWAPLNRYWLQLEFYRSTIPWWKASEPEGKQSSHQEST